jgi:tetratricopeptide (TPR) repeat protein
MISEDADRQCDLGLRTAQRRPGKRQLPQERGASGLPIHARTAISYTPTSSYHEATMHKPFSTMLSCLILAACVSAPPRAPTTSVALPEAGPAAPESASATTLLLEQGRTAREAGRYEDATTAIERALRIDPNNAYLWLELGEIKLASGNEEQADAMARKAISLAAHDPAIAARAERLIGH